MPVCILEQNPLFLTTLSHLLHLWEFKLITEKEVLEPLSPSVEKPRVLVFDERFLLPERRPFIRSMRVRFPKAGVLILGTERPQGKACELLWGIDGYVPYAKLKRELNPALRTLCAGRSWLPREVLEHFARLARAPHAKGDRRLPFTPREKEVIRMLTEGLANKEIANRLGVAERTVKFHAENIFAKLGVHNRYSASEIAHTLEGVNAEAAGGAQFSAA